MSFSLKTPGFLAGTVFCTGLLLSASAFLFLRQSTLDDEKDRFNVECVEIKAMLNNRNNSLEQILRAAAAYFEVSTLVTREDWQLFYEHQLIEHELPGIQGLGFAKIISKEEFDRHTQQIRAEGFPSYKVWPEGPRDFYTSIIYLEPFKDRNLRAFGYDMFTESVRRAAMERARDENMPAMSGSVKLVQETDKDIQTGSLMFMPVYKRGRPVSTTEERRTAILGWVYSPYRMRDLIEGSLGNINRLKTEHLNLHIYDGRVPAPRTLLYDSQLDTPSQDKATADFESRLLIDVGGREWTLQFTSTGSPIMGTAWIALGGWLGRIPAAVFTDLLHWLHRRRGGQTCKRNDQRVASQQGAIPCHCQLHVQLGTLD